MIEILKAIILGIVEGITEWLPISSTGHMLLVDEFLHLSMSDEFKEMFFVVIQLGAILAVVLLFWNKLFPFDFHEKPVIKEKTFIMWFKIVVATIPACLGIFIEDECNALFYNYVSVALALIVFGILFIVIENQNAGKKARIRTIDDITYQTALIIGFFQLIAAIFPGTSRSGATILGAILIGVSRKAATEFTFFLAIPAMIGASLLKMIKFGFDFNGHEIAVLLTGMLVAFIVSFIVIKLFMGYIKKHDFKVFGWYRIILGCIVLLYFFVKTIVA